MANKGARMSSANLRAARYVLLSAGVQRQSRRALSDQAARAELAAVDAIKDPLFEDSISRLEAFWQEVGEEAARRAERVIDQQRRSMRQDILTVAILSYDDVVEALQGIVTEETRRALAEGFRSGSLRIDRSDIRLNFDNARTQGVIDRIVGQVAESVDTAADDITRVVTEGLREGDTTQDIAARVNEMLGGKARKKAWDITSTSVNSGFEHAQMESFREADIEEKAWLSTRDGRVRDTHISADGQQVPLSEHFTVGGARLMYPGDPEGRLEEIIRCRCTSRPVVT